MSELLFKLIGETNTYDITLFNKIKNRLFKDYSNGKNIIKKQNLWTPLSEITKQLFGTKLNKDSFNVLYLDIDKTNKGYINKKQFNIVAKCLIMSIIAYLEKKHPIPGREISLCIEKRELPEQMEIIDTLTEDEIINYRRKLITKKRIKNIYRKKYRSHRKKKLKQIHEQPSIHPYLIEIDSETE